MRDEELRLPQVIASPSGTLDATVATLISDTVLAVALRDSRGGRFALWSLDIMTRDWTWLTDAEYRLPMVLAAGGEGTLLLVDATPGLPSAILLQGGSEVGRLALPRGIPREAVFDEARRCWYVAGEFRIGDGRFLAVRIAPGVEATGLVEAPDVAWFGSSGTELTRLIRRDQALVVTSTALCDVVAVDIESRVPRHVAHLDAGDPDLKLACRSTSDGPVDFVSTSRWFAEHDCPIRLFLSRGRSMVTVRRAGRAGWTLLAFDDAGGRVARADLPFEWQPVAGGERVLVTMRDGPEQAAKPTLLQVLDPDACLLRGACGARASAPGAPSQASLVAASTLERLRELSAPPLLVVDAHVCVGDLVRSLAVARARADTGHASYTLVLTRSPSPEYSLNVAAVLGRQVELSGLVVEWKGESLSATPIGRGLGVLAAPDR